MLLAASLLWVGCSSRVASRPPAKQTRQAAQANDQSPEAESVTFRKPNVSTPQMTTTRDYDKLNRLRSIASLPLGGKAFRYEYGYNDANQRRRVTLADGSYWVYEYDYLGQVKSGKKYWSDGTPVAGQQFEYAFDDIGNRTSTKAGGDETGAPAALRSATYTANRLNQYTSRTVPGAVDVIGAANPAATVTVSSQATYRRGDYYQKAVTVNNSASPVYLALNATATLSGYSPQTTTGDAFVPKTPENYGTGGSGYDADGNLLIDGRWNYTWDAENRLIRMVANTAYGPPQRIDLEYDSKGRRIGKKVWNNTAGTGDPALTRKFVYDGWNLVAELDQNYTTVRSYVWGLDLSGKLEGAGGVGGLLGVYVSPSSGVPQFAAYDGNGNVMGMASGSDGTVTAEYEYGPFGETIRQTGSASAANALRFSTKYVDGETGLLYFGLRYYSPNIGRWLSQDPIEEQGGPNLYGFVYNNPVGLTDYLGREIVFEGDAALKQVANQLLAEAKKKANAELKKKIAEMEADKFSCKIKLDFNSKAVLVGSYLLETVDLGDIEKFPNGGGGATRVSAFAHELVEQWEKQRNGKPYLIAHAEGMNAEFGVTGNVRGAQGSAVRNPDGSFNLSIRWTHTIYSVLTKNGVPQVEAKTITTIQTLIIKDNAVIRVETKDL